MSKRLSEIGIVGEFYRRLDPPFDMQILSVSDLTPGEKHYENVIVMNEEERRELVREAIKAFERWQSSLGSVRRVFTVEDFLDEQGL